MRRHDLLKVASATAGATAALAAQRKTTPLEVSFDEISRVLRDHGAIVPGHS